MFPSEIFTVCDNSKRRQNPPQCCYVPQCYTFRSADTSLFRIPKIVKHDRLELKKWTTNLKLKKNFPYHFKICAKHFDPKAILKRAARRKGYKVNPILVKGSLPTRNLPVSPIDWECERSVKMLQPSQRPRHVKNQKVLEKPTGTELVIINPRTLHDEPEIAFFDNVKIKEEPNIDITNNQQPTPEPSTSISTINTTMSLIEVNTEFVMIKNNSTSPITLYSTPRDLKRKLIETMEPIVPAKSYIKQQNKAAMIDQACQTDEFYTQTAIQDDKELIAKLKRQNEQLKRRLAVNQTDNQFNDIPIESLKGQTIKILYLTGFPNYSTMEVIYKDVEKYIRSSDNLSKFDVFFMTWMKLKLDLSLNYLSVMMNISSSTLKRLFYETFDILYRRLSGYIVWPHNADNQENTLTGYKQIFGDRRFIIVDCFEIFPEEIGNINNLVHSPLQDKNTVQAQSIQMNKTSRPPPVKYLICLSMAGTIIYLSKPFDARLSKKCIAQQSGFLDMIKHDDIILADREFVTEFVEKLKHKSKDVVPMVKNVEGELIEMAFEITDEFTKIRANVVKSIICTKQRIMMLTNRPPVLAVTNKYGEEIYSDFVIKMACTIVNLTPLQADVMVAEETQELYADE